jgi:zinc protease
MLLSRHPLPARRLAALFPLLLLTLALDPAPARAQATAPGVRIPVERYRLANGLEVLLHEDHATPVVFVNVTYHVGSANETPGKSGFAHLFEHMMFQGSKNVGDDKHFSILRAAGARGVNGTTNTDRTNYFQSLPANQLETALWLESDRMGYLLPTLTQKNLDNQRDVVRNERRMNYENVAFAEERFAIALELYPEGHPFRHLTIGRHEDLEGASLDDVSAFFAKWYVPANATLLIAGDIDVPATKALVDRWFGSFPRSVKPALAPPPAPALTGGKRRKVLTDKLATLRRIHYVWPTPAVFQPGDAELDLVAGALGSQTTGRLRKALIVDRPIARTVSASQQSRGFSSEFHVVVDLRPDANLEAAETLILGEVAKMRSQTVLARELKQAVASYVAGFAFGLEPVAARGQQLQYYAHHLGDPDFAERDLERYRKATPETLRAAAEKYLTNDRIEIITMPADGASGGN